ncbi:short chain dehydrogenase family protein [Auriculariales sp. MPI-PUGE-AT-0066]|nr:short chain dehydrogenase family protein [Auriculariales sp. MPI-PUGE-AT-0066]
MASDSSRSTLHARIGMVGKGKVALVVGASRGMGRQIALDLAAVGNYAVAVAAKTRSKDLHAINLNANANSSESTVDVVSELIKRNGGRAVAITVDVRDESSVTNMVSQTMKVFGRLDVLVYNPGAIWWASVKETPYKRFDLMQRVNPGGLYASIQAVLPRLALDGRIVVVSPPIYRRFVRGKTAYAMGKFGMSALTLGLSIDFERDQAASGSTNPVRRAITSIWPAAAIESAATEHNKSAREHLRKPTIFSDAILAMLAAPAPSVNGLLATDEDFLRDVAGVSDFSEYTLVAGTTPRRIMPIHFPELRVAEEDDEGVRMDSGHLLAKL